MERGENRVQLEKEFKDALQEYQAELNQLGDMRFKDFRAGVIRQLRHIGQALDSIFRLLLRGI